MSLMLIIDISFCADFSNMNIIINIKLYKIKILKIEVNLLNFSYRINKGKIKRLKLLLNKQEKYLISQIKSNILNKLYYDKVYISSQINLARADITSIVIGILYDISNKLNCILLSYNEDIEFYYQYYSDFNNIKNIINFDVKVYFTIFDMVYAIVLSFYKRGKYV